VIKRKKEGERNTDAYQEKEIVLRLRSDIKEDTRNDGDRINIQ